MDLIDIKNLSFPVSKIKIPDKQKPVLHKRSKRFLKGPIPWNWLTKASRLSGKALQVAVVVWFLAGIKRTNTIELSSKRLHELGVNRFAKGRGLRQLELNGLVSVERHKGNNPVVTILEVQEEE
jgi:hypothetical protein